MRANVTLKLCANDTNFENCAQTNFLKKKKKKKKKKNVRKYNSTGPGVSLAER